jgi:hypothetical protein
MDLHSRFLGPSFRRLVKPSFALYYVSLARAPQSSGNPKPEGSTGRLRNYDERPKGENGMTGQIDKGLKLLRNQGAEYRLDGLEREVRRRIEAGKAEAAGGQTWSMQLAVTAGSLLIGVFVAQLAGVSMMPEPPSSEIIVLSDDSAIAPSVILEGGI